MPGFLSMAIRAVFGDERTYKPPSCRKRATPEEIIEYDHFCALEEDAQRAIVPDESVACWDWPVTAEHRARADLPGIARIQSKLTVCLNGSCTTGSRAGAPSAAAPFAAT
jgi:hypothetical protein